MNQGNGLVKTLNILANRLLSASTQDEFFAALSGGQQEVLSCLPMKAHTPAHRRWLEKEIGTAFTQAGGNQRMRRALEALLWPSTAALMPSGQDDAALPEYTWVFTLPVRITFAPEQLDRVTILHGDYVPVEDLLNSLEQSGVISDKAILGGYSSLYRREDLFAYGPLAIPQSFLDADEQEEFQPPHPLPVILDSGLPGNSTVTFLVLLSARMPLAQKDLLRSRMLKKETRQILEAGVAARLRSNDVAFEKVEADQLSHLAELYLHSVGPLSRELEVHLKNLKSAFGTDVQIVGRIPAPGYFEVNVIDEGSVENLGIATFSTLEPAPVLKTVLEKLCERTDTRFKTVTAAATSQPSPQLH